MAKSWLLLGLAIAAEVAATSALKASDGFTRWGAVAVVVAGYGVALYLLAVTLRVLPVGVVYAVWSGLGIVFITAIGWWFFGQRLNAGALAGIALILAGVVILKLFSVPSSGAG
ncbi:MAG: multidrug efflux SMR transporter [Sinobacteraceae bacterium]|nr:multidrug efflux SMR transporter [Nevskiaceae bacterium]